MSYIDLRLSRPLRVRRRWTWSLAALMLAAVLGVGGWWAVTEFATTDPAASGRVTTAAPLDLHRKARIDPTGPEARLLGIYVAMAEGRSRDALERAQALVSDVPSFSLGYLVYADLLQGTHRPLESLGQTPMALDGPLGAQLADLRAEAQVRMHALEDETLVGKVPREFVSIPASVSTAIAVDGEKSRLYLLRNTPAGLQLAESFYVSLGKLGLDKLREGDMKTPLGVYFIMRSIEKSQLRELYGSGALPINFPNEVDRRRGRSGSGIWLHGVPPTDFSRPPLATDGCVVLSNRDLEKLWTQVLPLRTPVLITRRIEWVDPEAQTKDRKVLLDRLAAWSRAVAQGSDREGGFYTGDYTARMPASPGEGRRGRVSLDAAPTRGPFAARDVIVLRWKDGHDMAITSFEERQEGNPRPVAKRVYWRWEDQRWMIFHEDGMPA